MDSIYQTYLDNLTHAFQLSKPQIQEGMTQDEIIGVIRSSAEGLFRIHQENDRILKEILFSREAKDLTLEEVDNLKELADALFNYNRSADMGIAHYIHRLLYEYAKEQQDIDLEVRELYHMAITLLYMNVSHSASGTDMFTQQVGQYFGAGAAYLDRYEELENPETRSYILRCLGNMKFSLKSKGNASSLEELRDDWNAYMAVFDRAMGIFQSPHYREKDPDIPWDHFIYTMHYDRVKYLSSLRSHPDPDIAQAVMESADYVYRHQEQIARAKEKNVGVRTQYVYDAARYHAGLLPISTLTGTLLHICESADLHNFSGDNIWAVLNCPLYLFHYSTLLPEPEQEKLAPRLEKIRQNQREFLFLLPKNEYASQVAQALQAIATYIPENDQGFSLRILDYILACHAPTFVHSTMVALLSRRVCQQLLEKAPECLDGVFGFARATEHRDELMEQTFRCGLYHDLGKCMLLNYVGLYSRRLLDEEFACIKLHTTLGCSLLTLLNMSDISEVAHYHHCTFDGTGGYPAHVTACPDRVRPIVDIITVVDCLDAGTDNVGRSYAAAKTYGQIISELRQGKGTRYAPYIVELFDDPAFFQEMEQLIQSTRLRVYLDAYQDNSPALKETVSSAEV
ncbi:MAG: hypothetical protein J6J87_00225 [Oscillospiraceae bacterium]|nr:hypothetical protein [Oscillospiraceae bacterium]